jgi:hypothetical protein
LSVTGRQQLSKAEASVAAIAATRFWLCFRAEKMWTRPSVTSSACDLQGEGKTRLFSAKTLFISAHLKPIEKTARM